MKKLILIPLSILILALAVSCDQNVEYSVGSKGPAGGWIFYDCDADNDTGNADGLVSSECGWRFLEMSSCDLIVDFGTRVVFGCYMPNGTALYVNDSTCYEEGTSDSNDGKCTGTAIGTGRANTIKFVNKMGDFAFESTWSDRTISKYAAKMCLECRYHCYDDWFIPSKDELNLIYTNLKLKGIGLFNDKQTSYWSSSEGNSPESMWFQDFRTGEQWSTLTRGSCINVRPIRAFM